MTRGGPFGQTFHSEDLRDPDSGDHPDAPADASRDDWDDRDVLILELVSANTPHTGIARRLSCSVSTVERRLGALRAELGVETTIEVVVRAVRAGVI